MKNRIKKIILDILCDIVGSILYAMGIHCFAKMANFATGGVSGLALIMNHMWNLPVGVMTIAMNIPLVIVSWKIVGKKYIFKTAKTMVFTMIFLDKEVFIDRYYFNMPVKDIAKREGLKEKKVENILFRGKKKLKEALLKGGILL